MKKDLIVVLDGQEVGSVQRDLHGRLTFVYQEDWRLRPTAYPISLSMPLASAEHGHAEIDAFLWGLLPDNARTLEHWAAKFHVSAKNAFSLMSHVGEDCAGAIQFIRPDRRDAVLKDKAADVDWLKESEIAERLRSLRRDPSAWRMESDAGQFSLAGAQAKTAFLKDQGKWGIPSGRLPTTHIFKPPIAHFDGHVENEHFCLQLAGALGLPVPHSEVLHFEDQTAIVVERYDRRRIQRVLRRVHQEDFCQALALPPEKKYQNEGGPGVRQMIELLRTYSADRDVDIETFLQAVAFNWLIGGTDAHSKNYAVLLGAEGAVRLAPFYDLGSVLPYPHVDTRRVKMAMKIGGMYPLQTIGSRQWEKLAVECRLNPEKTLSTVKALAQLLPDHVSDIQKQMKAAGLAHPLIGRLSQALTARSQYCVRLLELQR